MPVRRLQLGTASAAGVTPRSAMDTVAWPWLDDRYGIFWSLTHLGWAAQNQDDLASPAVAGRGTVRPAGARRPVRRGVVAEPSATSSGPPEPRRGPPAVGSESGAGRGAGRYVLHLVVSPAPGQADPIGKQIPKRDRALSGGRRPSRGRTAAAAECLEGLAATLTASAAELQQAASLLGTAQALRDAAGAPVPAAELERHERDVKASVRASARTTLPTPEKEGAWRRSRMSSAATHCPSTRSSLQAGERRAPSASHRARGSR